MNKFKRGSALVLAGLMLWMVSVPSHGMGLGRPVSRAILGDTLSVSVPVRLDAGEDLTADCVKADVYFGDDKISPQWVQTQLKVGAAPVGHEPERVVQIHTTSLINEPVVTVYVVVGCNNTRITRKFVTLVDPPDLNAPVAGSSAQGSSGEGSANDVAAAPAPVKSVRDPVSRSSGLGRKAQSFSLSGGQESHPTKPTKTAKAKADKGKKTAKASEHRKQPAVDVPRLVLDPVATDAVVNPGLQMSGGLSAVEPDVEASSPELLQRRKSAAAIWQAMNASPEELARDRDRLQDLEHKLDALSKDSVRASEAVTGLQNRLGQRPSTDSRVVYGLGGLIVLLLGVMGWREWTMRKALADQSAWLTSQIPDDIDTPAGMGPDAASVLPEIHDVLAEVDAGMAGRHPVPQPAHPQASQEPLTGAADIAPIYDVPAPVPPSATLAVPSVAQPQVPLRAVSVDELIDLEQQAEFFVVLGQDDSAIEVLESYIHSTTAASPMPFLKLLEIYRRLDLRGAYERTRMNFNLRFNAHAPLWEADLSHGHELIDYPGIVERLQSLWPYPSRALEVLERSLMRQDAESYTFDLPAYRELLFLYAILRDLSENHPEETTRPAPLMDLEASSPLMATLPMKALPGLAPTLSLDLELDLDVPEPHHESSNLPNSPDQQL